MEKLVKNLICFVVYAIVSFVIVSLTFDLEFLKTFGISVLLGLHFGIINSVTQEIHDANS